MRIGLQELVPIVIIALVLFGGTLIPKLGNKVRESGHALCDEIDKTAKDFSKDEE